MKKNKIASKHLHFIFDHFEDKYIISLENRKDRRDRVNRNFASLGFDTTEIGINWFKAFQFEDSLGFPNVGVRGCFMSHLALLEKCVYNNRPMLIMEDDIELTRQELVKWDSSIIHSDWDIIYFGYLHPENLFKNDLFVEYGGQTIGGHFYAIKPQFAAAMVEFMSSCLKRVPGDPKGGPMFRDGAFNHYRGLHPEVRTFLANPSLASQFSSRSDLKTKLAFYDRVPIIRNIMNIGRNLLLN